MAKTKTSFKPGQSGNPNGRPPKGYSITEMMREMLNSEPETKEEIGKQIAEKAKSGDVAAIKMLWQYMDGMPQQEVINTHKDPYEDMSDEELEKAEANLRRYRQSKKN